MKFGRQKPQWPQPQREEITKRARLLIIDDQDFPYLKFFQRDGYQIEKKDDVESVRDLERGDWDMVLLDLHGVGTAFSDEQGLGVLRHLRRSAPSVLVIAYSNADWPLDINQDFFDLADATVGKSNASYFEFKQKVDEQLIRRYSQGFFIDRFADVVGSENAARSEKEWDRALYKQDTNRLRTKLESLGVEKEDIALALSLVQTAATVAGLWQSN